MKHVRIDYDKEKSSLSDHYGQPLTLQLFEEYRDRREGRKKAMFSIIDWRKKYIAIADPTEYETALVLIGNWEHWLLIRQNQVLGPVIDEWKQEVDMKLRSEGVRATIELARSGDRAAAKWLAEGGFVEDKRLRTQEGRDAEAMVKRTIKDRIERDAERVFGTTD